MGRRDLAAEDLAMAAKLNPHDADFFDVQGYAYEKANRPLDAEKAYQSALEINPRDKYALDALAVLYQEKRLNKPAEAGPLVAALVEYYPNYARGWLLTAAFAKGKDESVCLEALKKYLLLVDESDPNEHANIAGSKARVQELEHQLAPK
jgi:tetratricopeptide (TPR) repeat protein